MAIGNLVKRLQKIMRKDSGVDGDAQRLAQMVWVIFLKVYDTQEVMWEDQDPTYKSIIPEDLRWRNWARHKDGEGKEIKGILGGGLLLKFINETLFPVLKGQNSSDGKYKGLVVNKETPRHKAIVKEVFEELNQYMKDGVLLRQMVNIIDDIDLLDTTESHHFGDIYENLLKDLQSAGNAGEFYTPRVLTDFMIGRLNPRLGEVVGDFAMGTGGFLMSALDHLKAQRSGADDYRLWQKSIVGQEWKPFPYLLAVTNALLHDIHDPQLRHMDSLGCSMSDYEEKGKVDVIAMNPPYGGATSDSTKNNFKREYRSSETADLFMVLIMKRLAENGRAGVIVPDNFLFGTDGAKRAIKEEMLRHFRLHTVIRLPASVFMPYTPIATNIIFFDNGSDSDAPEGFSTARTWFYRIDMPEGYLHFSKTHPMLKEHLEPVIEWWQNRVELEDGQKSRCLTVEELMRMDCNLDQCKYPKEEVQILPPETVVENFINEVRRSFNQVEQILNNVLDVLDQGAPSVCESFSADPWRTIVENTQKVRQRLKESILQKAITGKLDTQDANDEPTSILLQKIIEEKTKLSEERKIRKDELIARAVEEDEKIFDVPAGWVWCRVESIFQRSGGKQLKGDDTVGELHKYITTSNVYWNRFKLDNLKSMYYRKREIERCSATKGDLLVCEGGDVGRCAVWTYDSDICLQNHVHRLRPYQGIYSKYVMYVFMLYKAMGLIGGKGIGIKGFSASVLKNICIPLPPYAEQIRIVDKIEKIFAEIDK